MSDIVERPRFCEHYEWSPLMHEAANEIERLNEDREKYFLDNLELRTEIERLRALVRSTYNEAFGEGMREHTSSRGGKRWDESRARAALEPKL